MEIRQIAIEKIVPNEKNPKRMSPKEESDLIDSIKEFGVVDPLIINMAPGREFFLIGGHQRLQVLKKLGFTEVPCAIVNIDSEEQEQKLLLRLSRNTGSWDWGKLKEFDLDKLMAVGFDNEEMSDMWDDVSTFDDNFKPERPGRPPRTTTVKAGDLYQLGDHRLMCGDSTSQEDVKKLMGEDKANMCYSDPPYNIGLDYNKGVTTNGKYQGEYKDKKTDEQYSDLIQSTIENALQSTIENAHFFFYCDEKYIWLTQMIYEKLGIKNKRVCLWIKNNQNPTPQTAFNKAYEPCVYGTKGTPFLDKTKNLNEVLNREVGVGNQTIEDIIDIFNIWLIKRDPAEDYIHPTQKPITLHEKPIKRCTAPGHIVLDLFAGSGSTLMACEQMKRRCFTMEKDPIFCQAVIDRWQEFTGKEAIKI